MQLYGSAGDDTITGSARRDLIHGGGAVDAIEGRDGPDSIFGEGGDDVITGGVGVDTLLGGRGNDTFVYTKSTQVGTGELIDGSGGNADTIKLNGAGEVFDFAQADISRTEKLLFAQGGTALLGPSQLGGSFGLTSVNGSGSTDIVTIDNADDDVDISAVTFGNWNNAVDRINIFAQAQNARRTISGSDEAEYYDLGGDLTVYCGGGSDIIDAYNFLGDTIVLNGGRGSDSALLGGGRYVLFSVETVSIDVTSIVNPAVITYNADTVGLLDGVSSLLSVGESAIELEFNQADFDASYFQTTNGWDDLDFYRFVNGATVTGTDRSEDFVNCRTASGGEGEDGFDLSQTASGGGGDDRFVYGDSSDLTVFSTYSWDGGDGIDRVYIYIQREEIALRSETHQLQNIERLVIEVESSASIDVDLLGQFSEIELRGDEFAVAAGELTIIGQTIDTANVPIIWSTRNGRTGRGWPSKVRARPTC